MVNLHENEGAVGSTNLVVDWRFMANMTRAKKGSWFHGHVTKWTRWRDWWSWVVDDDDWIRGQGTLVKWRRKEKINWGLGWLVTHVSNMWEWVEGGNNVIWAQRISHINFDLVAVFSHTSICCIFGLILLNLQNKIDRFESTQTQEWVNCVNWFFWVSENTPKNSSDKMFTTNPKQNNSIQQQKVSRMNIVFLREKHLWPNWGEKPWPTPVGFSHTSTTRAKYL